MTRWPINHLTADDLDAFHSASLNVEALEHLDECEACRSMALLDRRILGALAALPTYAPEPAFADRVMARVTLPGPALVRQFRRRSPATVGRLALAAAIALSLGASIVWSLFNRDLLLGWINTSVADTGRTFWLGVRVVATNVTAQPWYAPLRDLTSSPGKLVALVCGSVVLYGAAFAGLRRLMTPPSRPVHHALG